MAITFKSCANCDDCDDLLAEIARRVYSKERGGDKGLLTRIMEQIYGCHTPANTVSSHPSCANHRLVGTWDGHNKSIQTQHDRLKDAVDEYDNNDCGDKVSDPTKAQSLMRRARALAYPPSGSHQVPRGGYKGPPRPSEFSLPPEPEPEPESRWPEMPPVPPLILPPSPGGNRLPRPGGGGGGGGSILVPQLDILL